MFNVYLKRELVERLDAQNEREALTLYAKRTGITGEVKRDGGGLLYVGDAEQGRFYAREDRSAEIAAWHAEYPAAPFGTPVVLAEAMKAL